MQMMHFQIYIYNLLNKILIVSIINTYLIIPMFYFFECFLKNSQIISVASKATDGTSALDLTFFSSRPRMSTIKCNA